MPKARHPIEESEISRIFDDACIKGLATTRLLAGADLRRFAEGVREGARIYARDARVPTDNELHAEIAALYRAAERKQYEQVAALLEGFSPKARGLLNRRGARPSLGLELPAANALRDAAQQKKARETVLRLCRLGGEYVEGRRRSSGKRSRTWRPLLHTPRPSRSFPKRDAERNFVMQLQLAWLEATGRPPSLAANPARPGPFVRTVRKCLELVGASHADAVGLINELNRRRKRKTGVPSQPVRYQN
jgi:hypothetical protein